MLLDSHVVVWLAEDDSRLGMTSRRLIQRARTAFFSSLTVVELTMKAMRGRGTVPPDLEDALASNGLVPLPFTTEHATAVGRFRPLVGHDPFDRMLLAQAVAERMPFLTADRRLLSLELDWIIDATA